MTLQPFQRAWSRWKEFAQHIANFQSRLILTVFYFTVALPVGILIRLFADPLRMRKPPAQTGWSRRTSQDINLEAAKRQF
ncbi:MAG: hypothetical protein M3Y56_14770 [Armatimonadota bacterium]|nr:hypothetical protein [Armatimonadota bacterium]